MGSALYLLSGPGPIYLTESNKLYDGAQSDFCNLTCGIPQGFSLDPLLVTIYKFMIPFYVIRFQSQECI